MITHFDHETHTGTIDGVECPSVTQLITEFRLVDYSNVPKDRLEYKRILGTAVDTACDYWDRGELDIESLHQDIVPYFNAYRKFVEISGFECDREKSMKRYWSKSWRYHGQPDMVGVLDGVNVIVDRKCTWVLYKSGHVQTAAYKFLIEENENKYKIKKRFLLKLNQNGNYELEEAPSYNEELQDFFACLRMHWRKREYYKTQKGIECHE